MQHFLLWNTFWLLLNFSPVISAVSEMQLLLHEMQAKQERMQEELTELRKKCDNNEVTLSTLAQENSILRDQKSAGGQKDALILKEIVNSVENLKDDLNFLIRKQLRKIRRKRSSKERENSYLKLASQFENMKNEIISIKLLENKEFPLFQSNLDSQGSQLEKLLNLTSQLTLELNQIKAAAATHRPDQISINYEPTDLHKLYSEFSELKRMFYKLRDNQKWAEFIIEMGRSELRSFKEQVKEQLFEISETLESVENRTNFESSKKFLIGLLGDESNQEEEEFSGSGDDQIPPDIFWPNDLAKEIRKLRKEQKILKESLEKTKHWTSESLEAVKMFNQKLSQCENQLISIRNQVDKCHSQKADKSTTDILLKSLGSLKSEFHDLLVNRKTARALISGNFSQISQSVAKIRKDMKTAVLKSERALTVSDVIKEVQADHFTAIENFRQDLNFVRSDVLKFGLKLTTLQADFLNSTLYLYQTSKKDLQQDESIATANIRIRENKKQISIYFDDMKSLRTIVDQKIDYLTWKHVHTQMELMSSKIGFLTRQFENSKMKLISNTARVENLEYQLPQDCSMTRNTVGLWYKSGVYLLNPPGLNLTVLAYCDMVDSGGNWTLIQRRFDGLTDFNRTWSEYAAGFGHPTSDFWIGNRIIHSLTQKIGQTFQLRIDTWDIFGDYRFADYSSISIGHRSKKFPLEVGNFVGGNMTDAFSYHDGMKFSTADKDYDSSSTHCAKYYGAGWWFSHCHKANLNGNFHVGMVWFDNKTSDWIHLRKTAMKIRPFFKTV